MSLESAVVAEAAGWANSAEREMLEADRVRWAITLRRLLYDTDESIRVAARLTGDERDQVLADLTQEQRQLAAALTRLTGESVGVGASQGGRRQSSAPGRADAEPEVPGVAVLQGSWADGRLVVWAGGPGAEPADAGALEDLLRRVDGHRIAWERHASVPIPGDRVAEARSAPIGQTLGWLVGIGAGQVGSAVPAGSPAASAVTNGAA
ncbi:MAG: hypothetical protein J2P58_10340, partial [Acidimicrobiaceae bacterium]|nr:hypothetical protein [Acidimicrobiaceae bacterium]